LQPFTVSCAALRPDERVRVLARGKLSHIDLEAIHHEQLARLGGGPLTGRIGVKAQYDFRGKSVQLLYLLRCQRRPAGGLDGKARLVHLAEIEVPLDENPESLLTYRCLTEIQPIQGAPRRVDGRLWRVEVFGLLVGIDRASAEGDHGPGIPPNRDHQAIPE